MVRFNLPVSSRPPLTDHVTNAFQQLDIVIDSTFSNERGRRFIANLYRLSMRHMNDAIANGTIVFSRDPICQNRPVTLYVRLEKHLSRVISEAEMSIKAIDELYRLCHEDSKSRRMDIVARLDTEHKRANSVRQKYSAKYAKVTNKDNIDAYTLESAQNRIREKADRELDSIRICVNDLLKEETALIMKIK